ncbi:MAG TPA: hypothetical protein VKB67_02190 [Rhizomicrobium sp.]|nr:hypothetical protein [Rhizomicrobium sp.]
MFITVLFIGFVTFVLLFQNLSCEREAAEFATPAHAACQKNLGQMALIPIIVQTITHGLTFGHCVSFHWFFRKLRHTPTRDITLSEEAIGSRSPELSIFFAQYRPDIGKRGVQ